MGLFDIFKKKEKEPVVVHKTTTVVKKNTVVVKKNTPKEEPKKDNGSPAIQQKEPRFANLIVCLDPGHAVSTPGKRSPYSVCKVDPSLDFYEYKFNREIVDMLAKKLSDQGIEVFITTDKNRDGDIDVSLTTRATRAWNKIKASGKKGIFISIHANANGKGSAWDKAKGWSTYTTKGQNISDQLADYFYDEAEKLFDGKKLKIRTDKSDNDRDWEENFTVIFKMEQFSTKNGKPTVPSVLTENFFYSNVDDCKYLCSNKGKEDIVKLHFQAILSFVENVFKL